MLCLHLELHYDEANRVYNFEIIPTTSDHILFHVLLTRTLTSISIGKYIYHTTEFLLSMRVGNSMSRIQINYCHPTEAKTIKTTKTTAALILATFAVMTIGVVP
jgi:hypothetical protein